MAKLPEPPSVTKLRGIPPDVVVLLAGTRLYRVYFRGGRHPGGWGRFRGFGPLPSTRFDHHSESPRVQERAILYAAAGEEAVATCVAEALQEGRLVDTRLRDPQLAAFSLVEDVPLLSLRGRWPTRAGASVNTNLGPRPRCRRWSKAVY